MSNPSIPLPLLQEYITRSDQLMSYPKQGLVDLWFLDKVKLSKILQWKPFESFHYMTYTHPIARKRFLEGRYYGLLKIRELCMIYYLNTGRTDSSAKEAIDLIDDSLKRFPYIRKNRFEKIKKHTWKLVSGASITSIISATTIIEPYYPILLLIGVMALFPALQLLIDRLFVYAFERYWHKISLKKLGIPPLEKIIIKQLIDANNKLYREF